MRLWFRSIAGAHRVIKCDVVGLGYCSYDYLAVVPERPDFDTDTLTLSDFATDGGGPVSTALVALARLCAQTAYLGVLGDDAYGQALEAMFGVEGVDCTRLRWAAGCRSQMCVVLVEQSTGRRSILCHRPTYPPLALEDADFTLIATSRALHLDSHHMDAAMQAAQFARSRGITVSLDANRPREGLERLLPLVDLLIASGTFPSAFMGIADIWEAMQGLCQMGPEVVVVTEGDKGCIWLSNEGGGSAPGFRVQAVDTTGAGDAFHGAFLFGHLRGWPVAQTAEFANAVAAINCTRLGGRSGLPTLPQTLAFLREHSPNRARWNSLTAENAENAE
jgi:sugar/nucleoside kinase (ribokinase family)